MLRKTTIALIMFVLAVCAGCQSHAQNKKAAKQRWEKASAQIKLTLARQRIETGDYAQVAKIVQECLTADPDNPQVRLLFGRLLLAEGRRDKAIEQLSLALESDERLDESWYWLGVAAEENREYQKAYRHYDKAMSLEPTNVDYILAVADAQVARNNCSQAIGLLTRKMMVLPRDISLKVAAADLMLRQGDTQGAISLYERAVLLTNDSDIAETLGYCYILDGRWKRAAEVFEEIVGQCKDERKSKPLLRLLAVCNMNAKRYSKAVSCYSKLAVEERENAEFWLQMGQAALGVGAANRAFICGQRALSLQPGWPDAIALCGCARYMAKDYDGAVESFEKIAADEKNAGFSWLMRARCYEQLGETSKAERAYKKALEINPRSELGDFLVKGKDIEGRRLPAEN